MTNKTKLIIAAALALLLFALGTGFFIGRKQTKAKDRIIEMLVNQNQAYTTTLTQNKQYITTQDQRIVTLEMARQALLVDIDSLKSKGIKDVSTIVRLNTEVKRLKLAGTYTIPVEVVHDTVVVGNAEEGTWLKIPKDWTFKDKWLDIDGTVKATEVTINKLVSYSQPSITLGYSRGFLKKSKPIVVFEDANPYTLVTDMSNVVIINKPPFYKRPWFHMVEGAAIVVAGAWGINQFK
jgi:hypothetical protein